MEHPPKYPSTPHWPESEKLHRDDTYHTDPEHFVGKDIVITEKLDGGNTCLWGGEVYARSVAAPSRDGWMAMVRKHHAWKVAHATRLSFYGEDLYGIHSIEYDALPEDRTFNLFAIFGLDDKDHDHRVFSWESVETLGRYYNLPVAPLAYTGKFHSVEAITQWFKEVLKKPSHFGPEKEGFVMRIADGFPLSEFSQNVCKYVRANHVQTDQHWRRNWRPCKLKGNEDVS